MGLVDTHPNTWMPKDDHGAARVMIGEPHAMIHRGRHYTITKLDLNVDIATTFGVLITAPATGEYHFVFGLSATNSGTWTWSEAPNATGGSALIGWNNNRNSSNVTTLVHTYAPSITSVGSVMVTGALGSAGQGNIQAGGLGSHSNEFELAVSTKYLLNFTAINDNTLVSFVACYYLGF